MKSPFPFFFIACFIALIMPAQSSKAQEHISETAVSIDKVRASLKDGQVLADGNFLPNATTAQIDELFKSERIAKLPLSLRLSALALAGQGNTLHFEKPSDIFNKVRYWFLDRNATKKRIGDVPAGTDFNLPGPEPEWSAEAAAFVSLWRCLPGAYDDGTGVIPFSINFLQREEQNRRAAIYANYENFSDCMDHFGLAQKKIKWPDNQRLELAKANEKLLSAKFGQFLASNACTAEGIDDCVFVLSIWSALTPYDQELAKYLKILEPVITDSIPENIQTLLKTNSQSAIAVSEVDFFLLLRRNAFFRAKLASIAFVPAAWKDEDLISALRRLSSASNFFVIASGAGNNYSLEDFPLFDPWQIFNSYMRKDSLTRVALERLFGSSEEDLSCGHLFEFASIEQRKNHALSRYEQGMTVKCMPDIQSNQIAGFGNTREEYLRIIKILDMQDSGLIHEELLNALHAYQCFEAAALRQSPNLRYLCSLWVHEPQVTNYKLRYNHLRLTPGQGFYRRSLRSTKKILKDGEIDWSNDLATWITPLMISYKGKVKEDIAIIQNRLQGLLESTILPVIWVSKDKKTTVIELHVKTSPESEWPVGILLIASQNELKLVNIPQRFHIQESGLTIAAVSDLDRDGDVEIWFQGKTGECDEDGLKPGIDCAIPLTYMGEVFNDTLSYFIDNRNTSSNRQSRIELVYKNEVVQMRRLDLECKNLLLKYQADYKNKKSHKVSLENFKLNPVAGREVLASCRDGRRYIVSNPVSR